jgi:hypothetical protein
VKCRATQRSAAPYLRGGLVNNDKVPLGEVLAGLALEVLHSVHALHHTQDVHVAVGRMLVQVPDGYEVVLHALDGYVIGGHPVARHTAVGRQRTRAYDTTTWGASRWDEGAAAHVRPRWPGNVWYALDDGVLVEADLVLVVNGGKGLVGQLDLAVAHEVHAVLGSKGQCEQPT